MSECLNIGDFPKFSLYLKVWPCFFVLYMVFPNSAMFGSNRTTCMSIVFQSWVYGTGSDWMFHIIKRRSIWGTIMLGSLGSSFFQHDPKKWRSDTYIPWLHPNLTGILTGRWLGPHVATHDSQCAPVWTEDPLDMYDIAASGLNTLPTMQIQFIYRYKHIQTRYNMQSQTQLLLVFSDWYYSSSQHLLCGHLSRI